MDQKIIGIFNRQGLVIDQISLVRATGTASIWANPRNPSASLHFLLHSHSLFRVVWVNPAILAVCKEDGSEEEGEKKMKTVWKELESWGSELN